MLPGDVIARYYRAKEEDVLYVSGSDCHGTPISIRAKKENVNPKEIVDRYHNEFKYCLDKLGFSYDIYSRTAFNIFIFQKSAYAKYVFLSQLPFQGKVRDNKNI